LTWRVHPGRSRVSLSAYIRDKILIPLGMNDSARDRRHPQGEDRAIAGTHPKVAGDSC
jgi:CubicO group peptidase (beta-lactamase class C family)